MCNNDQQHIPTGFFSNDSQQQQYAQYYQQYYAYYQQQQQYYGSFSSQGSWRSAPNSSQACGGATPQSAYYSYLEE